MEDPLQDLTSGLQALDYGKMSAQGFDLKARQQQLLGTGPFKDANSRHTVWGDAANKLRQETGDAARTIRQETSGATFGTEAHALTQKKE